MRNLMHEFNALRTANKNTIVEMSEIITNNTTIKSIYDICLEKLFEEQNIINKEIDEFNEYIDELQKYYTDIYNTINKQSQRKLQENINTVIQKINDKMSFIKKKCVSFKDKSIPDKITKLKEDIQKKEQDNNNFYIVLNNSDKNNNDIKQQFNNNVDLINENISLVNKLNQYIKMEESAYVILINRYMTINNNYKTLQSTIQRTHRNYIKKFVTVIDNTIDDEKVSKCVDDIMNSNNTSLISPNNLSLILSNIKDRHESIIKLEQSLKMLHDLFSDIAIMINSQGEMIDNICANVHETYKHTYNAKKYIINAKKYNDSANRNIICIFTVICLIMILLVIILVVMNTVLHII